MAASHGESCGCSRFPCLAPTIATLQREKKLRSINYLAAWPQGKFRKVSHLLAAEGLWMCVTGSNAVVNSLMAKEHELQCRDWGTGRAGMGVRTLV